MPDNPARPAATWRQALSALHRGAGLRRQNLYAYLGEELRALWCITPDMELNDDEVYAAVVVALDSLIEEFPFPDGKHSQEAVRRALHVSYNASDLDKHLISMDYGRRRDWLDKRAPKDLQIPDSTTRAYLSTAIETFMASVEQQLTEQPDKPQSPPVPNDVPATKHKTRKFAVMGAAVVVLAIGGLLLAESLWRHDAGSNRSTSAPTEAREKSKYPLGTALQLTTVKLADGIGSWSAAFPNESSAAAFTPAAYRLQGNGEAFFARELRAGAYGLRGVAVNVEVRDVGKQPVTISNVRVIDRTVSAPLVGEAVSIPSEGAPTDRMAFSLDAATPIAKVFDRTAAGYLGKDNYFDAESIPLDPGGKSETLALTFAADRAAYTFNIAIDYTLDGKQYTQIVTNGGQPFRATASLCSSALASKHLHYGKVLSQILDTGGLSYTLTMQNPGLFCTE